jgi:hypothetical protein
MDTYSKRVPTSTQQYARIVSTLAISLGQKWSIDTMKSVFFKESLRLLNMQLVRLVIEKGWSVKIFGFFSWVRVKQGVTLLR